MKNRLICKSPLCLASILGLLLLLASPAFSAETKLSGLWDATIHSGKVDIPFHFEIAQNGNTVEGFFFEGDKKIGSTSGSFDNGTLKLDYDYLNTALEAAFDGDQLHGTYRNTRNNRSMEFSAKRFTPTLPPTGKTPQIAGNYEMYHTAPDGSKLQVSWRLYLRQSGSEVSGAILKTSGDEGTLSGHWEGDKLVLSHFSGDRPMLFEATVNPDKTLSITLDRQFTYKAAKAGADARAAGLPLPADPSRFTSVKDPSEPFHFSGVDVDGKTISDADPRFQGKVVLLTIGGTWCPNCRDQAPLEESWYKELHSRGLEVVGLSFESDADPALYRPRIVSFVKRYGIEFPMIMPGTQNQVAEKLPQLVNFGVYPTTIFLGRDGRVRAVHAGFASAATGEAHTQLLKDEHALIEQLLAEKPQKTSASLR